jgi:hypothetical protein
MGAPPPKVEACDLNTMSSLAIPLTSAFLFSLRAKAPLFFARGANPDKLKPVGKDGVIACLTHILFNGVDHLYRGILYPAAMDAANMVMVALIAVKPHLAGYGPDLLNQTAR